MYLATTAEVPIPSPMARLSTRKVTGKVKLMADSGSVPSMLMKRVSTRLKVKSMNMPKIIGPVMRVSVAGTGSRTRL